MAKGRCLLFLGPEYGEKQDAINELRESIRKKHGTDPEETSFYAGETPVTDMVSILRNGSLFSDTRLFFIKNAELIKKKEDVELLAACMGSPPEGTTLILISETTGIYKGLEETVPREAKRIFWELFENRKTEWISSFFRRQGYRIYEEGIEAILEMVENNTDSLRRECSRLMLFVGKDRALGAEDVEKWLSHTREESAFTLFSRIAGGDLPRSIETLHTLLAAKETPQAILAGLTWCYRKLQNYIGLVESGIHDEFEFKKIGLASSLARKDYAAAARRYSEAAAAAGLALIAEFDILIRSAGSAPEAILMDLLLYKLILGPEHPREVWRYY
ncbi:MAG: DNA polymerase III subunit delta [Treponema sp.]|jgi:DNA polymerase-3 subunit delta|nr:DNA polymerase III subunit delta [Treponema sp.]